MNYSGSMYVYRSIGYGASRVRKSGHSSRLIRDYSDGPSLPAPRRNLRPNGQRLSFGTDTMAIRPVLASSPQGYRASQDGKTIVVRTSFRR
jgi:hypothetical protein